MTNEIIAPITTTTTTTMTITTASSSSSPINFVECYEKLKQINTHEERIRLIETSIIDCEEDFNYASRFLINLRSKPPKRVIGTGKDDGGVFSPSAFETERKAIQCIEEQIAILALMTRNTVENMDPNFFLFVLANPQDEDAIQTYITNQANRNNAKLKEFNSTQLVPCPPLLFNLIVSSSSLAQHYSNELVKAWFDFLILMIVHSDASNMNVFPSFVTREDAFTSCVNLFGLAIQHLEATRLMNDILEQEDDLEYQELVGVVKSIEGEFLLLFEICFAFLNKLFFTQNDAPTSQSNRMAVFLYMSLILDRFPLQESFVQDLESCDANDVRRSIVNLVMFSLRFDEDASRAFWGGGEKVDFKFIARLLQITSSMLDSQLRLSLLANLAFGELPSERVCETIGLNLGDLMDRVNGVEVALPIKPTIVSIVDLFASLLLYLPNLCATLSLPRVNSFVNTICRVLSSQFQHGCLDDFSKSVFWRALSSVLTIKPRLVVSNCAICYPIVPTSELGPWCRVEVLRFFARYLNGDTDGKVASHSQFLELCLRNHVQSTDDPPNGTALLAVQDFKRILLECSLNDFPQLNRTVLKDVLEKYHVDYAKFNVDVYEEARQLLLESSSKEYGAFISAHARKQRRGEKIFVARVSADVTAVCIHALVQNGWPAHVAQVLDVLEKNGKLFCEVLNGSEFEKDVTPHLLTLLLTGLSDARWKFFLKRGVQCLLLKSELISSAARATPRVLSSLLELVTRCDTDEERAGVLDFFCEWVRHDKPLAPMLQDAAEERVCAIICECVQRGLLVSFTLLAEALRHDFAFAKRVLLHPEHGSAMMKLTYQAIQTKQDLPLCERALHFLETVWRVEPYLFLSADSFPNLVRTLRGFLEFPTPSSPLAISCASSCVAILSRVVAMNGEDYLGEAINVTLPSFTPGAARADLDFETAAHALAFDADWFRKKQRRREEYGERFAFELDWLGACIASAEEVNPLAARLVQLARDCSLAHSVLTAQEEYWQCWGENVWWLAPRPSEAATLDLLRQVQAVREEERRELLIISMRVLRVVAVRSSLSKAAAETLVNGLTGLLARGGLDEEPVFDALVCVSHAFHTDFYARALHETVCTALVAALERNQHPDRICVLLLLFEKMKKDGDITHAHRVKNVLHFLFHFLTQEAKHPKLLEVVLAVLVASDRVDGFTKAISNNQSLRKELQAKERFTVADSFHPSWCSVLVMVARETHSRNTDPEFARAFAEFVSLCRTHLCEALRRFHSANAFLHAKEVSEARLVVRIFRHAPALDRWRVRSEMDVEIRRLFSDVVEGVDASRRGVLEELAEANRGRKSKLLRRCVSAEETDQVHLERAFVWLLCDMCAFFSHSRTVFSFPVEETKWRNSPDVLTLLALLSWCRAFQKRAVKSEETSAAVAKLTALGLHLMHTTIAHAPANANKLIGIRFLHRKLFGGDGSKNPGLLVANASGADELFSMLSTRVETAMLELVGGAKPIARGGVHEESKARKVLFWIELSESESVVERVNEEGWPVVVTISLKLAACFGEQNLLPFIRRYEAQLRENTFDFDNNVMELANACGCVNEDGRFIEENYVAKILSTVRAHAEAVGGYEGFVIGGGDSAAGLALVCCCLLAFQNVSLGGCLIFDPTAMCLAEAIMNRAVVMSVENVRKTKLVWVETREKDVYGEVLLPKMLERVKCFGEIERIREEEGLFHLSREFVLKDVLNKWTFL